MPKDHLLYEALQQRGLAHHTFSPLYPDTDTLCLVHDQEYVNSFVDGSISPQQMRRIGLPWSPQLMQRTLIGTGSAILAARLALQYGVACMTNGGTHHAHADHGTGATVCVNEMAHLQQRIHTTSYFHPCNISICSAGWCIFNDLAVAARAAQRDAGVGKVLLLDLDVHQGDGSAAIFRGDPSVFTFSVHCKDQSFPLSLQKSDLDIALPAGTGDQQYMQVHSLLGCRVQWRQRLDCCRAPFPGCSVES